MLRLVIRRFVSPGILLLIVLTFFACVNDIKNELNVPKEIEVLIDDYVRAWTEGDTEFILNNIYGEPFTLFLEDTTIILKSNESIRNFLDNTFLNLKSSGYDKSMINKWESFKSKGDFAILGMNYTRFLKDGSVMGAKERSGTYILKKVFTPKSKKEYRILSIISHNEIDS